MDDLNAYLVFPRVVELNGFSAAAADLGLSKSAVSKQIAALEEQLGVRLLNRTTRRIAPTEAGLAFYEKCRRIADEVAEAKAIAGSLQTAPHGTLRLSAPLSFGIDHLGPLLPEFMRLYPDVKLDVSLSDQRIDLIEAGVDAAIRIGELEDSGLVARRITAYRRVVVAAPSYWAERGMPARPEDLASHDCLTYAYAEAGRYWPFKTADGREFSVAVSGSLRANNGDLLVRAATAGLGVCAVPAFLCAGRINSGELALALEAFEPDPIGVYIVFPHARHMPTKLRVFIDFLTKTLVQPKATLI